MTPDDRIRRIHRSLVAANRRDWDAVLAELSPRVVIDDQDILDADSYGGYEDFFRWLERWNESWESWRIEDADVRVGGERFVVALFRMVVKGAGSGIEMARLDAMVYEFENDKVAKIGYYNDQAQALEAAGLTA